MPGLSRPYSNWSVRQMSRYVPEVSGYTDHPHAPLGTNVSTPSRGKLPRLLSRVMFTMSIRDNTIFQFFYLFLRFVTAVLVLVIPSYVVCLWTARYFTSSCNVHVTWGHLNISGRFLTVCNNKKTPTTTGMSPQGRKLDRRWRQQIGFTASRVGMGDILMRTPTYESLLVSVEFQMARTVI